MKTVKISALSAAILLSSFASTGAWSAKSETVTIGLAGPLTGPSARIGKDLENGAQLAIDDINKQHPTIGGKAVTFRLQSEDDQSDPRTAVAVAQRRGLKVVPLVGPSSILMALMGSGFNGQSFAFNGYLPIEPQKRASRLREMENRIRRERQTQIFIETPYRNNKLIAELSRALPGQLRLCVASDITGKGESIVTRPLSQWAKASYDYAKVPTIFLLFN